MSRGPRFVRLAGLALSGLIAASSFGADTSYENHQLLDVNVQTPQQLRALNTMDCVILNCTQHLGTMKVVASPDVVDALNKLGISYDLKHNNVQRLIEAERDRMLNNDNDADDDGRGVGPGTWYDDYHTWEEINDRIDVIEALRPDLVDQFILGTSIEGRDIHAFTIGAGPGKPVLIFNGCQHAREWASPASLMFIAEQLVRDEDTDPEVEAILDTFEIVIIPVVNPDGYEFTYAPGGNRFWRKNRRNNGDGTIGVDLNRNWSVGWGGGGSSGNTDNDTYRGTAPFSEPESAALSNYILSRPEAVAHIDFHTFSQLILWPYGYDFIEPGGADGELFTTIGNSMADAIFDVHGMVYEPQAGHDLYQASGVCPDWAYDEAGLFSWTFELRDNGTFGFDLPPDQIIPCGEENYAAVKNLATSLLVGVQFDGSLPDIVNADETTDVGISIAPISSGALDNGSGEVFTRINGGAWSTASLAHNGDQNYTATLPAAACDQLIEYYVTIDSVGGTTYSWPTDAPASSFSATAKDIIMSFEDDFETNMGWTVTNGGGLTDGAWERGVPAGVGDRGDPTTDGDGSGSCYVTDNVAGNSDVDNGTTTLTSPTLDASDPDAVLSYTRWYSNTAGSTPMTDTFVIEVSDNDGASWVSLEDVGPGGSEVSGGWYDVSFVVADIPGITNTTQLRVRFAASDLGDGSVVEAGVDGVRIESVTCPDGIFGDLDNDGTVGTTDLLMMLGAWGGCELPCPPSCVADLDEDCNVGVSDLLALLANWG